MKKSNRGNYLTPTEGSPSRIVLPIGKSLPMPERIIPNSAFTKNEKNKMKKNIGVRGG